MDPRFVLAIVLQESSACVRAPTTSYSHRNPGLMQSHDGVGTCNERGIKSPCPTQTIEQMIRDGVLGTSSGDGLRQLYSKAGGNIPDVKYYNVARMYNSGSLDASGDLEKGVASHCYVSDVANRLTGWTRAQKTCQFDGPPAPAFNPPTTDSINMDWLSDANKANSQKSPPPQNTPASSAEEFRKASGAAPGPVLSVPLPPVEPASTRKPGPQSFSSQTQQPQYQAGSVSPQIPNQPPKSAEPKQISQTLAATSNNRAPGVTTKCAKYYTVQDGDFCLKISEKFGVPLTQLKTMNAALDDRCGNLWLGYDYCIQGM